MASGYEYEVNPTMTNPSTILWQELEAIVEDIEQLDPEEIAEIIEEYLEDHPIVIGVTEYVYNRNGVPAQTWIINHNLVSKYPTVELVIDDHKVDADLQYSVGVVTVEWGQPEAGIAVLREGNT